LAVSCDPITAARIGHLGKLTVDVNCNDAAAAGAEPIGLLVTLLMPPDCSEAQIAQIAEDLAQAAKRAHVAILGGHTEVSDAVTRPITCATVLARKSHCSAEKAPKVGDALFMSKWAGLEGTAILATDFADRLRDVAAQHLCEGARAAELLSILPEARIAMAQGVSRMHDVTEGGVLGAAWELAQRERIGLRVDTDAIPVLAATKVICEALDLNPLRLIGSGSLLFLAEPSEGLRLAYAEAGILVTRIGTVIAEGFIDQRGNPLRAPGADELYRVGI
jgi:hydrogenase expression/formation protein HypE